MNFQPVASLGLAWSNSTSFARGWQVGLLRTAANR
ncbi:glucose/arabinose dehydrogenase [Xanthomonas sacchari]|nr:glucose/arabinose dehydrogenase [Xanthomonas sacchari]